MEPPHLAFSLLGVGAPMGRRACHQQALCQGWTRPTSPGHPSWRRDRRLWEKACSTCHEQTFVSLLSALKLYVTSDLGKKWTLLQERVTKDHVFW